MFRLFFLIVFLLYFSACQPLQYTASSSSDLGESSAHGEALQNMANRLGQTEFEDIFTSYKLDLVFVLDTHSTMKNIYKKNLFGNNFLDRFKNYDWKIAYTDMSVDTQYLREQSQKEEEEEEESYCGFFPGLLLTTGSLVTGSPYLFSAGADQIARCFDFSDEKEVQENPTYANGLFLPFEYEGQKVEAIETYHQLNKSVANYNDIFKQSFQLHSEGKQSYSAPVARQTESYPFISTSLSLVRGGLLNSQNPDSEKPSFFREDSLIVYVLITAQDIKMDTSSETYQESVKFMANHERIKVIPVTISSDNSLFCGFEFPDIQGEPEELLRLSEKLGAQALDICSSDLGEELFEKISETLHSQNLLI